MAKLLSLYLFLDTNTMATLLHLTLLCMYGSLSYKILLMQ